MSKLEKTKTILDYLKSILLTFIVGLFGIASYTFIHIDTLSIAQMVIIGVTAILDIIILTILVKFIIKKLDELEKL
jgi:hypothetical protein